MKKKRIIGIFVIVLVIIEITSIFLMYKSGTNRKTVLDTVKLNEIDKYSGIALMLQQNDGTYKESESGEWPTSGYVFNNTLSGCIDGNGNTLSNALTYKNGTLTVKTRTNASCYLYFDIPDLNSLCEKYDDIDKCSKREDLDQVNGIWDSTLEGDGFRYTGTNPDNYICFGTTKQSECISNPDKYMYRIIGIFEDETGTQHLKLIKKTALNTTYHWNSEDTLDVLWGDNDLFIDINYNALFLENTNYSYMLDNEWYHRIATWKYTATNTLTYTSTGPDYNSETVQNIYLHEMNRDSKTSTIGEWTTVPAKIGLMYVSDYLLSLGQSATELSNSSSGSTLKTGWMHLSNNDSGAPSQYEWTMSRSGDDTGSFGAWSVYSSGYVNWDYVNNTNSVRPVFYLKSGTKLTEGNGKESNPYIIGGTEEKDNLATTVIYNDLIEDDGLQQTIISGDDLYRFSGTSGNTGINNYICLGTDSCTSGDDNMYRIIGVNPSNHEVKVIKETPWNSSTTYKFHSANTSSIRWITSSLYTGTVSAIYDTLSFKDMIVTDHSWNVGSIGSYSISTRANMVAKEVASTTTANIGILSMTDYFLAYNGNRDWNSSYNTTTNWIGGYLNGNTSTYEWTMSHYNNAYAFAIYSTGRPYYRSFSSYSYVIRPTMYLSNDVMYVSGDGTSSNPYVVELKVQNGTNNENNSFTAEDLIASGREGLWESTLEDDGYRFVGEDPDNYICFGTTDESECTGDTDKYMYRIIGIFEDSSGKQHLKLIKKEALNNLYAWHSSYTTDTDWDASDLYKGINGSYFLTNTTYSYMQDTNWTDKIATWDYTATNTLTQSNSGPNYYNSVTVENIYLHEMNRSSKPTTVGEWKTVSGKISLMYASDYLLSLGSSVLSYKSYTNRDILKTGWMQNGSEWIMTRHGLSNSNSNAWYVQSNGNVNTSRGDTTRLIRPVFYLTSDVKISGEGTPNSPFMVSMQMNTEQLISNSGDDLWDSTLEDDGYRYVGTNPANYVCFGYSDSTTDCDFTNATNSDLYAYRIIGIFEDSSGEQHLKLIKKEALNTAYYWNNGSADWANSSLYRGLNGSYFLSNTDYAYMQDDNWENKIETWNYSYANTLSYENYNSNNVYGPNYYYQNATTTYLHEMNRSSKSNQTCYYTSSTTADCTVGKWYDVDAKIGLMYASDYLLSLGSSALSYTSLANSATLQTGWMHISNNDTGAPEQFEFTMTRYGNKSNSSSNVYYITDEGEADSHVPTLKTSIRPVFYLTSNVKITGEGTSTDPYIIS